MVIQYIVRSLVDSIVAGVLGVLPAYHPILLSFSRPELAILSYFIYYAVSGPISFLLGAYSSTVLFSRLAAHSLISSGRAERAVFLYLAGFVGGVLLSLLYYPVSGIFSLRMPSFIIFFILLVASALLILRARSRAWAVVVFSLAALWGVFLLSTVNPVRNPLQVGVSGIFGLGAVLPSLFSKQRIKYFPVRDVTVPFVGIVFGSLAALLVAYFPALSPAVAALFISLFVRLDSEALVASSGSTAASALVFSMYSRQHGLVRSSLAAQLPRSVSLLSLLPYILVATFFGALFVWAIFPLVRRLYARYSARFLAVILILLFVFFSLGLPAFFAVLAGASLSIFARSVDVDQSVLMAFLIVPTMLYYAPM